MDAALFHYGLIYKKQAAGYIWRLGWSLQPLLLRQKSMSVSSLIVGQAAGRSSIGECTMFPREPLSGRSDLYGHCVFPAQGMVVCSGAAGLGHELNIPPILVVCDCAHHG